MPHSRHLPRFAPGARITVRLSTAQRDLFLQDGAIPQSLGHALHRAPVRDGKLAVRIGRESLDALIAAAARSRPDDRRAERELNSLLRYLESLADRFLDPSDSEGGNDDGDAEVSSDGRG